MAVRHDVDVRYVAMGNVALNFRPGTAGAACNRCDLCGYQPQPGERVWLNCYADLICDSCARRRSVDIDEWEHRRRR